MNLCKVYIFQYFDCRAASILDIRAKQVDRSETETKSEIDLIFMHKKILKSI
jgi:hypothetical protein